MHACPPWQKAPLGPSSPVLVAFPRWFLDTGSNLLLLQVLVLWEKVASRTQNGPVLPCSDPLAFWRVWMCVCVCVCACVRAHAYGCPMGVGVLFLACLHLHVICMGDCVWLCVWLSLWLCACATPLLLPPVGLRASPFISLQHSQVGPWASECLPTLGLMAALFQSSLSPEDVRHGVWY